MFCTFTDFIHKTEFHPEGLKVGLKVDLKVNSADMFIL